MDQDGRAVRRFLTKGYKKLFFSDFTKLAALNFVRFPWVAPKRCLSHSSRNQTKCFLARHLHQSLLDRHPETWALPLPRSETLAFFG